MSSKFDEHVIRKTLLAIQSDGSLTPSEKARRMQELMTMRLTSPNQVSNSPTLLSTSPRSTTSSIEDDIGRLQSILTESDTTFDHVIDNTMSCPHYQRNCKLWAECCQEWVMCRHCHNNGSDHELDRFGTRFMLCGFCRTVQAVGQQCCSCGECMAAYYCPQCKLWSNDPCKSIYHCEQCRICRSGRREDFVHCDRCKACLSRRYHAEHKCLEGSLEGNCPICSENLFASTQPSLFMPCGHAIHTACYQQHIRSGSYVCPVCCKSVGNMREYFEHLDRLMRIQRMPPEYRHWRAEVLCNDCEKRSIVAYHFLYHKCSHCASYNTKLLKSFPNPNIPTFLEDDDHRDQAIDQTDEDVIIDVEALHPDDPEIGVNVDAEDQIDDDDEIISSSSSES